MMRCGVETLTVTCGSVTTMPYQVFYIAGMIIGAAMFAYSVYAWWVS
jgi:hypothetical protein